MNKIESNLWKLYIGTFLRELLFIAAIIVPFLGFLGLTMQQILITEAVYSATIVCFEIPSGYFADRIGRKISIILAALLWIVGISFYAFGGSFELILIGAFFWGMGTSFSSGADEAMLFETLVQMGREKDYKKVQGDIFFYGRMAAIIGSIGAGFMASVNIKIPAYANLTAVVIWLFVSFTLKETRHEMQVEDLGSWKHFRRIFRESFIHNKELRNFILFTSVGGFYAIGFWLNQRYWEFLDIPIVYFGFLVAGMSLFSAFGSKYAKEIEEKIGEKAALILISIVPIFVWLIYSGVSFVWVVLLAFLVTGLRGFQVPVFNDFIQRHSASDRRATVMSVKSFLQRMVFLIFAPFLGWVTDVWSIQTAFWVSAMFMGIFAIFVFFFLDIGRDGNR